MTVKLYIFDDTGKIATWWWKVKHSIPDESDPYSDARKALFAKFSGVLNIGELCIEFHSEEDAAQFLLKWG